MLLSRPRRRAAHSLIGHNRAEQEVLLKRLSSGAIERIVGRN